MKADEKAQNTISADLTIAFIGAGNMATSIAGGLVQTGLSASNIVLCDPSDETRQRAEELLPGVQLSSKNEKAVGCDVIILSVKPQIMEMVCTELSKIIPQDLSKKTLFLSVAAGITIEQMQNWIGQTSGTSSELAIVRCMPNTPALVNEGATGYFANTNVSTTQKGIAHAICSAVGDAVEVTEEDDINAVTAISGSGPAYFFFLMEAMIEAGQLLGMDHQTAERLTLKTALGAAKLASDSSSPSPNVLRERVTSPKGTTEAAIKHMEQSGMKTLVIEAIKRAHDRAIELSE